MSELFITYNRTTKNAMATLKDGGWSNSELREMLKEYKVPVISKHKIVLATAVLDWQKNNTPTLINNQSISSKKLIVKKPRGVKKQPVFVKEPPVLVAEPPVLVQEPPVLVQEPPVLVKEPPVLVKEPPVLVKEPSNTQLVKTNENDDAINTIIGLDLYKLESNMYKQGKLLLNHTHFNMLDCKKKGQLYSEFKSSPSRTKWGFKNKHMTKNIVYIVLIGDEHDNIIPYIESIINITSVYLGMQVKLLDNIYYKNKSGAHLEGEEFTRVLNFYTHCPLKNIDKKVKKNIQHRMNGDQLQINFDSLHTILEKYTLPNDGYCLLGITLCELYDALSCIQFSYKNNVGIMSITDYVYDYSPSILQMKFPYDISKIVVKNILHMFGVYECVYFECLMNNTRNYNDNNFNLCPVCLHKLFEINCIDIPLQYKKMYNYLKIQRNTNVYLKYEYSLYKNKLKMLNLNI